MKKYIVCGTLVYAVAVFDEEVDLQQDFSCEFCAEDVNANFDELPEDEQEEQVIDYIQSQNEDLPAFLDIYIDTLEEVEEEE